ncbi:DUF3073 domain-containing protein [uncultured Actinomyces sp.]|uniref:DUF3073 domain-containing protein n=1 Tax=uncultured Actinomyces sp. TaxID=249061 RepID=UPI0026164984|nr:DUF3073 domain-containing protein [uncultured Actinomyces sp.]
MGRGRQKAKQTKVARKLKYTSPETDFDALQRELAAERGKTNDPYGDIPPATDEEDWGDYDDYK